MCSLHSRRISEQALKSRPPFWIGEPRKPGMSTIERRRVWAWGELVPIPSVRTKQNGGWDDCADEFIRFLSNTRLFCRLVYVQCQKLTMWHHSRMSSDRKCANRPEEVRVTFPGNFWATSANRISVSTWTECLVVSYNTERSKDLPFLSAEITFHDSWHVTRHDRRLFRCSREAQQHSTLVSRLLVCMVKPDVGVALRLDAVRLAGHLINMNK